VFEKVFKFCCILCLAVWCSGCSDSLESTVRGVVTYHGKPVADAMVNFHPKQRSPTAYDMTDQRGRYFLKTGTSNGIVAGGYWVTITGAPEAGLPEQYHMRGISGLEFEVISGKNQIDIVME
jgi:hypothetical protein